MSRTAIRVVPRRSEADDPTLPAILEFQWPSTAILNTPIPRSARGILWVVASLVAAMITAMGLIPIDEVVTARGIVVSKAPTILVQPLETAIVRSIDVHEGQHVRAGDILARLDPTFAAADVGTLEAQQKSLAAEVARLRAESTGQPFAYGGDDPDLALQAAIWGHRKAEFEAKLDDYNRQIGELAALIARAEADAAGYRNRLKLARTVADTREKLEAAHVGSHLNTLAAEDNRAEMARALANAEQTAESSREHSAALTAERDSYIQGWRGDVGQKLAEATGKLTDAEQQLKKATLRRRLVELRADRDAIVQSVAKVSAGSVMQPSEQFITLVPTDVALEVEADIQARENGFVHVGDRATIKFDTFPFSQYGMAKGEVRVVSPDSFTAEDQLRHPTAAMPPPTTTTEPFYLARVAIEKLAMRNLPPGFHLIPGMPVTADIEVGKRTVLTYLLGRIIPVAREGMREP
jgi:hemolysin D